MLDVLIEFSKMFGAVVDVFLTAFALWAVVSAVHDFIRGRR